jgi:hypothetical protein
VSRYTVGYDARGLMRDGFGSLPRGNGDGRGSVPIHLPPPRISRVYPLDPAVRLPANIERAATLGATVDGPKRKTCRCCGGPARGWWRDLKLCRRCGLKGYAAWKGAVAC